MLDLFFSRWGSNVAKIAQPFSHQIVCCIDVGKVSLSVYACEPVFMKNEEGMS